MTAYCASARVRLVPADIQLARRLLTMDLQTLQWIEYNQRLKRTDALPRQSGVYLVAVDNKIVYIGSARSVWDRLYCHEKLRTCPEINRALIACIPVRGNNQRDKIETGLIVLFRPPLNRRHNYKNNGQFRLWSRLFTKVGTELAQAV